MPTLVAVTDTKYSTPKDIIITWINNNSWEMMKRIFPKALTVNKYPKTTVCTSCKYVDDKRQHRNEIFESPKTKNIPSLH